MKMSRRLHAVLWAGVLAASILAGCSDSGSRQAGRNLREARDKAQSRFEKALALLGSPVYGEAGTSRFVPLLDAKRFVEPNQLDVLPGDAVNPNVLPLLDAGPLTAAILANEQAEPADKALAYGQVGRIWELKGLYHALAADQARHRLDALLTESQRLVTAMQAQAGGLTYCQVLLDAKPDKAKELLDASQRTAQEKAGELATLDADIQRLDGQIKGLQADQERLTREASAFRLDGKATTGQAGLDLVEKAIAKQTEADKAASGLSKSEGEKNDKVLQRTTLAADANLANALTAIAQKAIQSHQQRQAETGKTKDALETSLAENQKTLDEVVGKMTQAAQEARQSEKGAADAYAQAATNFGEAHKVLGAEAGLNEASRRAALCAAQADLRERSLRQRERLDGFVAEMKKSWPNFGRPNEMPETYSRLPGEYMPEPAQVRAAADKACKDAIAFYSGMVSRVRPELKWAYQALLGTSYLAAYECSRDVQDLTKAAENVAEAIKDKEFSPFLADVVEIHRHVQYLQEHPLPAAVIPAPSPASTPAPRTAPARTSAPATMGK